MPETLLAEDILSFLGYEAGEEPEPEVVPATGIQAGFEAFHAAHPEVLVLLLKYARQVRAKGWERYGIGSLFERIRWEVAVERGPGASADFKLNNNYRSRYARLLMEQYPNEFAGFFETRELRSA